MKQVWMLEDDRDDRSLVHETLLELHMNVPIRFFSVSGELFDALSGDEKPALLLVDDNATPDNGLEVLKKLKHDPACNDIPVVVLSESADARHKSQCYIHGASSFIKKPDTIELTRQKIGSFFSYWFETAEI